MYGNVRLKSALRTNAFQSSEEFSEALPQFPKSEDHDREFQGQLRDAQVRKSTQ